MAVTPRFIRTLNGYNHPVAVKWRVGASQTINVGDIVQIDPTSRYLVAAVAASTTIAGIAEQAITTGASPTAQDAIFITPVTGGVFRVNFTGSTKTTLADTDKVSTIFDLSNKTTINLDDTTGGMCSVLNYDNTNGWADVYFASASVARI